MNELTSKQQDVLEFIEKYQMEYGRSPTLREMREHFQVSSDNSILKHLKALEAKGFLQKDDRGIALLGIVKEKLRASMVSLPILGSIPAGGPVLSEEHVNGWMNVESAMVKGLKSAKDAFILSVTGESMIDAGIFEGDLVIASMKQEPRNGDVVIALIDGGNTLKRFVKEGERAYLRAENSNYHDDETGGQDILPADELTVQGVVTGLIRKYY